MGNIRLQNVTRQFGGQIVLDDVTLDLHDGHIVGLVGPNGAGKTTLFRLITGALAPDMGTVTRSRGMDIGYLEQEPRLEPGHTVHDEALSAFSELLAIEERIHALSEQMATESDAGKLKDVMAAYDRSNAQFAAAGGYEIEKRLSEVMGGLGFSEADFKLPVTALSGGQKCRLALAKLLMQDRSFLLLDEPTNHLDIDAVRWLEKFLAGHHGGAVVISHDRYLLDRVADGILEVQGRKAASFKGNYTNYARTRAVRALTQERQYKKDREFIEKERDFIARHLAGQRSNEAKGRRTRLERRLAAGEFVLEKPGERASLAIKLDDTAGDRTLWLSADGLSKRYGEKLLFDGLSFQVRTGQRMGITGPNGTGKSTLLKVLMGQVAPDAGRVEIDRNARIGYFAQDVRELDPGDTVLGQVLAVRPTMSETSVRSLLGRFLFTGQDAFKPIAALSGGEQSRVRLIRLILSSPNMLILDEPTNHLDIPSREVLEEALTDYEGAMIVVSHDRYFLDRIVNRLMVLRDGSATQFNGNYSFYIDEIERRAAENSARDAVARQDKAGESRATRAGGTRASGKPAAGGGAARARRSPLERLSVEQLEAKIHELEAKIDGVNQRFGDPAVYSDAGKLGEAERELNAARAELAEVEEVWLKKSELDAG